MGFEQALQIIAQNDGGSDLIEVLVLFIIMAISALGSVLKSRSQNRGAKNKQVPPVRPDRPSSPESSPTPRGFDFARMPERKRDTPPLTLGDARVAEPSPPLPVMEDDVTARDQEPETIRTREYTEAFDLGSINIDLHEPKTGMDLRLHDLSVADLRRAILLKEVFGLPRAMNECGDYSV